MYKCITDLGYKGCSTRGSSSKACSQAPHCFSLTTLFVFLQQTFKLQLTNKYKLLFNQSCGFSTKLSGLGGRTVSKHLKL